MSTRWITADVFDGLATLGDGSVDLIVTSPPFLALRSYLPADHPDKSKEIGSEATPAEFIDTMLAVTAELRRVLAPHGSICVELGDTYAGHDNRGSGEDNGHYDAKTRNIQTGEGWPLAKSRTLIPQLYEIALAYGINPLTGQPSPAGQWRIRNVVTWARPNPPVGALGDKWRPATSDLIVACTSSKRYWDDLATRKPFTGVNTQSGAPLLDYWEIPPGGYKGAHYAVFPSALVEPLVKAMCPPKVCRVCGEPVRRIHQAGTGIGRILRDARESAGLTQKQVAEWFPSVSGGVTGCVWNWENETNVPMPEQWSTLKERLGIRDDFDHLIPNRTNFEYDPQSGPGKGSDHLPDGVNPAGRGFTWHEAQRVVKDSGWTDCGHDNYRPGHVLDCFAGSGTTGAVASGHGHDVTLIDLDERNADLARERIGPLLFEVLA